MSAFETPEKIRCACSAGPVCDSPATEEDLLCNHCRAYCKSSPKRARS